MKKLFLLISILAITFFCTSVFATNEAKDYRSFRDYGITGGIVGLADASDGYLIDVDSNNHLQVDIAANSTTAGDLAVKITDGTTSVDVNVEGSMEVDIESISADEQSSVGWVTSMVLSDNNVPTGGDCTVDTGTGIIQTMYLYTNTADDYCLIYDNTSATGTILYDIQGAANGGSLIAFTTPIPYSTGIFAYQSTQNNNLQITWKSTD